MKCLGTDGIPGWVARQDPPCYVVLLGYHIAVYVSVTRDGLNVGAELSTSDPAWLKQPEQERVGCMPLDVGDWRDFSGLPAEKASWRRG